MNKQLELVWARWCARRVLHLWDASEVVREWVDTGEEALREEAAKEAWAAAWAARAARAAESAESAAQQHASALITTLATLLPEHGLSALRLDEAQEDRWLTREVWRALGLPDLQVVCDWAGERATPCRSQEVAP